MSDRNLGIIPAPLSVKVHSGYFQITNVKKAAILYETEADLANARLFQEDGYKRQGHREELRLMSDLILGDG